jgi:hypothetical protein
MDAIEALTSVYAYWVPRERIIQSECRASALLLQLFCRRLLARVHGHICFWLMRGVPRIRGEGSCSRYAVGVIVRQSASVCGRVCDSASKRKCVRVDEKLWTTPPAILRRGVTRCE